MVLLIVLWAIATFALISAVFTTTTRTETNRMRNVVENAKAEGLADAGIYRSIVALLEADPSRGPRADGTTYRWSFGGAEIDIAIESEAGKIDINTASDRLLEGVFLSVGIESDEAQRLVDAIRDFADEDDLQRPFGAEDADYAAVDLVNGAKDGSFDRVAELQQVFGMRSELYDTVAPILTVYSGGPSVDPSTASSAALLALPGATQAQVDAIMKARVSGPSDLAVGTEAQEAAPPMLGAPAGADPVLSGQLMQQRQHRVFTITATAKTPGGGIFVRAAVVSLTGDPAQPFVFHEWRQVWATSEEADGVTDEGPRDTEASGSHDRCLLTPCLSPTREIARTGSAFHLMHVSRSTH
jgi:general secretion pathway protein K